MAHDLTQDLTHDLTQVADVVSLMGSSKTEKEWDHNCELVKEANDGQYPRFWHKEVIQSGIYGRVVSKF